ncbi:hypothetical protein [Effusibacillus consociatus]|uniref:Diguanylate cyclase n=1 Tax=Effusibacillus consociatus TaxID=1117041 RepID=A0ABV9Q355_9BACL
MIYADLDYFKWFNDQFGFQQGDPRLLSWRVRQRDCRQRRWGMVTCKRSQGPSSECRRCSDFDCAAGVLC